MLLFQCTKDAAEALTVTRKGVIESFVETKPAPIEQTAWVWQLHAVKIDRKLVFIAMQADTRFAMVFWGIKKGDAESLLQLFFERLANHVFWLVEDAQALDEQAAFKMVDQLLEACRSLAFHAGSDRSVQTHINEVARQCKYGFDAVGHLPDNREEAAGFDENMNQMPRSVRGGSYFFPAQELLCNTLRDFAGFDAGKLSAVRQAVQEAKRRQGAEMLLGHAQLMNPQEGDAMQALIEQLLAQGSKGKKSLH
ncbi:MULTISPECIES: DUF6933 domain-containing protein [Deefgea]|uniref:DUF6933 domain-containing protein n=1 Tax=Deefgea chitinilytica TaxID=570276 RepID=A0ABS2CAD4_9NEIS|nr:MULTISPECIES: hypothetical protein [Deefgea]MBM5571112.1 hypothetical protein [Deefgea chitinilytica]MBM9888342.1 hypothetical protein [Deefgea sp. CFH1-16]